MPINRKSLYWQFAHRFRPATSNCRIVPVTHEDIDAAESTLGCKLPTSYRTFVTEVGAGDNDEPDAADLRVAEIWHPDQIVQQVNEEWYAPIPAFLTGGPAIESDVAWNHLTPFASEQSHGFWFCFPRERVRSDDPPVYFFNHDGGDIERVADGLDDLIRTILLSGAWL